MLILIRSVFPRLLYQSLFCITINFLHYTHVHILNLYYFKCTIRSKVLIKYIYIFTHNVLCTNACECVKYFKGILPCLRYYWIELWIDKDNGGYRLPFTLTCTRWAVASVPYRLQNLNAAPTQTKLVLHVILFIIDFRKRIIRNSQSELSQYNWMKTFFWLLHV